MLDLTRLPEAELSAFVARQPWFLPHGREGAAARVVEATYVHTVAPLLAIALVEVATERGPERDLPAADRAAPRGRGERRRRDRTARRLDGLRRDLRRRGGRRARRSHPHGGRGARRGLGDRVPARGRPDRSRAAARPTLRADRRGALQQLRRRTARSSCSRSTACSRPGDNPEIELLQFLTATASRTRRALLGSFEHSGRLIDSTLGILTRFVPAECDGWTFALSSLAGDPVALPRDAHAARRGHRSDARRARIRLERSRVRRGGAEQRVLRAARGHARRGDRDRLRASARERGARADRRARGGGARARATALEHELDAAA